VFPLHASAASRAILSCLSDAEIEDFLNRNAPLKRFTDSTLVMPDQLREEVRRIRQRGYAVSIGDYYRSGNGFSFPFVGADGHPHGAITVGAPESEFPSERAQTLLPAMLECIERLRREAVLYDAR
jgi:IclR family acetate operon transcriptional repressor